MSWGQNLGAVLLHLKNIHRGKNVASIWILKSSGPDTKFLEQWKNSPNVGCIVAMRGKDDIAFKERTSYSLLCLQHWPKNIQICCGCFIQNSVWLVALIADSVN